jgi:hypothetical protein
MEGNVVTSFILAKQVLYCLSHNTSSFFSGYFWRWFLTNNLPRLALNHDPPSVISQVAWITGMSHQHPASILEERMLLLQVVRLATPPCYKGHILARPRGWTGLGTCSLVKKKKIPSAVYHYVHST